MADDAQFQINLVTPERILLSGMATEVLLRTGEGDATFLANHTALVDGELDEVPEQAFLNVGGAESVLAKAHALEND